MRIALDAMGGDFAPQAMVQGAIDFARAHSDCEILLVGQEDLLRPLLPQTGAPANLRVHHAPEVIGMGDKIDALKQKPDDSMNVCARLVKAGQADGMVLCGNTACSVAAAQLHLRRIKGVKRAGILVPLPNPQGLTWLCDGGANAVGKPEHLAQFAEMGSVFLQAYSGIASPRVGVLSIGEEDGKGDELTGETLSLLRSSKLNVVGNVEGHDIYEGTVDVVVCDGFTGNVVLKTSEGVAHAIKEILAEGIRASWLRKLGYLLMRGAFGHLRKRTHWSLVGGCLLLGVDGVCIIGHGRSDAVAVFHALGQAKRCVQQQVMAKLRAFYAAQAAAVPEAAAV